MLTMIAASSDRQPGYRAAVVIPTVLRPSLARAVRSVFQQRIDGRIQVLIGIDRKLGDSSVLETLRAERPDHVDLYVLDPGYSTARAHGGLYSCAFGGSLRSALTLIANSRHVAYLDDDNWFAPDHLSSLLATIEDADWAFSRRWYVDGRAGRPVCVDEWESVGPDAGVFNLRFGGFVDTSSLLIHKIKCHDAVGEWSLSDFPNGDGEDRRVFHVLRTRHRGRESRRPTSFYVLSEKDGMHPMRIEWMRSQGYIWAEQRRADMTLADAMRIIHPHPPYAEADNNPELVDLQGWASSDSPVFAEIFRQLRPKDIVEVGSWKGRSAIHMAELARGLGLNARIVCVDTWLGGLDHLLSDEWRPELRLVGGRPMIYSVFLANVLSHGFADLIVPFPQTSTTAAAFLLRCGVQLDLVHIDASHEEADVLADCRAWWKLLRPGGVLLGDDYTPDWPGVVNAANLFAREVGCRLQVGGPAPFQKWVVQKNLAEQEASR